MVMDYYNLTASSLANELDIQRSGISHLLSERNKPSLEFVLKLNEKFPDVDIYWLTLGKGTFPAQEPQKDLFNYNDMSSEQNRIDIKEQNIDNQVIQSKNKELSKIILFYTDKSFEIFEN